MSTQMSWVAVTVKSLHGKCQLVCVCVCVCVCVIYVCVCVCMRVCVFVHECTHERSGEDHGNSGWGGRGWGKGDGGREFYLVSR